MNRIAILSVHTSPIAAPGGKKVGGLNTYVREIAREFAERGIIVDIFTRRTSPAEAACDNSLSANINVIHVTAGPVSPLGSEEIYPHLQQFTAGVIAHTIRHNINYDMIFSHYWLSGWVAQKLKEAWGTPFVQMFHTLGHMKNRIPSVQSHVPELRIRVETQAVEWADRLLANTPAERAQLLWLYHADRRKIIINSPGVNTERFAPMPQHKARRALNLPQDKNLLVFVGRIEPLKAVDSIIEALVYVRNEQPDLMTHTHLYIIGGDPKDKTDLDMMALQRLTRELDLTGNVQFLGAKDQAALSKWYAAATTVIMPSEYESFGMVALEAMASGTPVIASEVGGLAYLVKHEETGLLVPARSPRRLAEGITQIITQPQKTAQMGQQAADYARQYAWPIIADKLLTAFDEMLTSPRRVQVSP
jgi:D-inositol-3-phosphate glycosyltransferase